MSRKFRDLLEAMSPQRRGRISARTAKLLADLPLQELRKARDLSQEELADTLGVNQATVSKLERRTDMYISTMRRFVDAMGGELEITARFPDGMVRIDQFGSIPASKAASRSTPKQGAFSMAHGKKTSKSAASKASKTLSSKATGKASKSAAGSALSQSTTSKTTSQKAAAAASKTLRDGRTSKASKSAAGSALSQKHGAKKKK